MSPSSPRSHRLVVLLCILGLAAPALAETKRCTVIATLPYTISAPGNYCLQQDLAHPFANNAGAVRIQSSNVVLDCNGHRLEGTAGAATKAMGVIAFDRQNITVRNCHVHGFQSGIWLRGGGLAVHDNLVERNTAAGIYVHGDGSVVRRNRVLDIGGDTAGTGMAVGVRTYGNVDVLDNTIAEIHAAAGSGQAAYGIYADVNDLGVIGANRIRRLQGDGASAPWGMRIDGKRVSVHGNRLSHAGAGGVGIGCSLAPGGIASGNHLNGFDTALQGCHDGGHNVVLPSP